MFGLAGHKDGVLSLAAGLHSTWSDSLLLSGSEDTTVRVWDIRTRKCVRLITAKATGNEAVTSVAFSKKQPGCIAIAAGTSLRTFDMRKNTNILLTEPVYIDDNTHQDEINQICFDDIKGRYMASCDDSGTLHIHELRNRQILQTTQTLVNGHTNICGMCIFSPIHSHILFSGGYDCRMTIWDTNKGRLLHSVDVAELEGKSNKQQQQQQQQENKQQSFNPPFVNFMSTSSSEQLLACALGNGAVQLFDISNKVPQFVSSFQASSSPLSSVVFVGDGTRVATLGNDHRIILWDTCAFTGAKTTKKLSEKALFPTRTFTFTGIEKQVYKTRYIFAKWMHHTKPNYMCIYNNIIFVADVDGLITGYPLET